ncbi:hypothetical protein ACQEUX_19255 [Micromonospora sp. CA-259024]|uniref:hypothetical protein n=1 Tax=Micromonospora sp. CA-259024 TaxID=3239965 RepID=UPI003D8CB9B5
MIIDSISSSDVRLATRLDSSYHLSPGVKALARVSGVSVAGGDVVPLGSIARIWAPKRFKREYAVGSEEAAQYLRPYDVFDYLPAPADLLSVKHNEDIDQLRLSEDMLILTCSGRNLGPAVAVEPVLARS